MALSKTLEELVNSKKTSNIYCPYQTLYQTLTAEDQKTLDKAWNSGVSVNMVIKALRREGHKISNDSIRAHIKGLCKCPK